MKPGALTKERQKTHGDWAVTARIAGRLKSVIELEVGLRVDQNRPALKDAQREALDMILCKIARIVSGDPNHPDHWDDIAGYAQLAREARQP
jgi:hypothetical protein